MVVVFVDVPDPDTLSLIDLLLLRDQSPLPALQVESLAVVSHDYLEFVGESFLFPHLHNWHLLALIDLLILLRFVLNRLTVIVDEAESLVLIWHHAILLFIPSIGTDDVNEDRRLHPTC